MCGVNAWRACRLDLEMVQKDISSLTTEEKLEILTAEAPELLGLVQDFRNKITLMRERVFPLIQRYALAPCASASVSVPVH